jgi:TRAP transporter TAXI family solute receptor
MFQLMLDKFKTTLASIIFITVSSIAIAAAKPLITITTGQVAGIYYPTAQAICKLFNADDKAKRGCEVHSSSGSVHNIYQLSENNVDLAIVQTDILNDAYHGSQPFQDIGADKSLRAVAALYDEVLTVLVSNKSSIKTLSDLKGNKINIGSPWSGGNASFTLLMKYMNWTKADFAAIGEAQSTEDLCEGKVDALIYIAGQPNKVVQSAVNDCDARIIPVEGAEIDRLLADHPYYLNSIIAGGTYSGNPTNIHTIGVKAILVASTHTSNTVVREVLNSIFNHFESFVHMHSALSYLTERELFMYATSTGSAPLHDEALKFYKEKEIAE